MESYSFRALVTRLSMLDVAAAWQLAGWTMLHFLWVGAILAAVAGLLRLTVRRARPQVRYLTAVAMLALVTIAPAVIAAWILQVRGNEFAQAEVGSREPSFAAESPSEAPWPVLPRGTTPDHVRIAEESAAEVPRAAPAASPVQVIESPPPPTPPGLAGMVGTPLPAMHTAATVLPYIWLAGTPCMFLLLATGLVGGERLRRRSRTIGDGPLLVALDELRTSCSGRAARRLAIAVCDRVTSPVLVGIVRPVVLFPPAAVTGWSPEQIEMILLHELAHVRRWDNLVNLLQRLIESLLFFHPAVWWLSGWVRQEREHCCDAFVVRHLERQRRRASRRSYARLLLELAAADRTRHAPTAATAFAASNLKSRVRHILNMEEQPMHVSLKTLLAMLALAMVTIALMTTAARGLGDSDDPVASAPAATAQTLEDGDSAGGSALSRDEPNRSGRADDTTGEKSGLPNTSDETTELSEPSDASFGDYAETAAELEGKLRDLGSLAQKLFGGSSSDQGAALEAAISRWQANRAERRMLHDKLAHALRTLQVTAMQRKGPGVIERRVQEAVSASPRLQQLQMHLLWLNTQIDQLRISVGNRRSSALARLEEQKQQVAQQMQQIETQERQRLTSEYESQPSLILKLLRKQWEVQRQVYGARIAKLDEEADEIFNELEELTKGNEELEALFEELKELSTQLQELSRDIKEIVPDDGSGVRSPGEDALPTDPDPSAMDPMESLEEMDSSASSTSADGDIATYSNEAASNGQAAQPDDALRKEYERKLVELNRQRTEYLDLAQERLRALDGNQNLRVKTVLMRWQANRVERRALATELADADEDQEEVGRTRLEALDREAAQLEEEIRELTKQNAELIQRQEELVRLAKELDALEQRLGGSDGTDEDVREPQLHGSRINSDAGVVETVVRDRNLTYDGEDFDHWKTIWRTELKPERRTEAIRALAAFGAHGYGREAAETILDVVDTYAHRGVPSDSPEGQLIQAAVQAFTGPGTHIPLNIGLEVLLERVRDDGPRRIDFARSVVAALNPVEPAAAEYLLKFSRHESPRLSGQAIRKLPTLLGEQMRQFDHVRQHREEVIDRLAAAIAHSDPSTAAVAMYALYPGVNPGRRGPGESEAPPNRAGYRPELLTALRHDSEQIRGTALAVLARLGEEARPAVPELTRMLQSAEPGHVRVALVTLGRMGDVAQDAADEIVALLKADPEFRDMAMQTLAKMRSAPDVVFRELFAEVPNGEVLEQLAIHYGGEARPALDVILPHLVHEDAQNREAALNAVWAITSSHDVAEEFLKNEISQHPRNIARVRRAAEMLDRIKVLRATHEQGPQEEGVRLEESGADALELPRLAEMLQSGMPEQIRDALIALQVIGPAGKGITHLVVNVAKNGPDGLRKLARGTLLRMQAAPELMIGSEMDGAPVVVEQIDPQTGQLIDVQYGTRGIIAQYGEEAVLYLLPLLTREEEAIHRTALQGLADLHALDEARRYLERRLTDAPAEQDAEHLARMLKWVNALIEYYAEQQPRGGEGGEAED